MSMKKYLAMFPGQGSQRRGMGKGFYETSEIAKRRFDEADAVLAALGGEKISTLCFDGPQEALSRTQYSQPAILTVSLIAYEIFLERFGYKPTVAAGHSLGEYTALVAAGVLSFSDAVGLVHKRGLFMQDSVAPDRGAMVAILGKEINEVEDAIKGVTTGLVSFANINAPGQIVIAGEKDAVYKAVENLGKVKSVPLPVSVPSHTELMKPAAEKLAHELERLTFSNPLFPVYSNVTGLVHASGDSIKSKLVEQLVSPVQWVACVTDALSRYETTELIEFGYGEILFGLARRIAPDAIKIAIDSPDAVETYSQTA